MLAVAEAEDGGLVGGVYAEVKAADAFDGEDFSGGEPVYSGFDWVIGRDDLPV